MQEVHHGEEGANDQESESESVGVNQCQLVKY